MINHLPVFAPVLAIPLLLLALWKREEKAIFIGAVLLLVLGAIGGIVSVKTGEKAQDYVEGEQGVSMRALSVHEERAEAASLTLSLVAIVALAALYFKWKRPALLKPEYWIMILLFGAVVASSVVGFAALKGGEIRHPEIRPKDETALLQMPGSPARASDAMIHVENEEEDDDDDDDD